jgi:damage-control phosphatase, subfamily I
MRTYLDCLPCFLSQALRAARAATEDESLIKRVLDEVGRMLEGLPLESTPPESGRAIYRKVSEITGIRDPFRKLKQESTRQALSLYPSLKERVAASPDRLETAVRIAISGNVIDFGPNRAFDLEEEIAAALKKEAAVWDYPAFKEALAGASAVLYIGDNAGECVFDRILIEELAQPVTFVVREVPVINDATREDAMEAGIHEAADVISSGTDAPGTLLNTCSNEFRAIYDRAECIISKGQGNYEALSDESRPIFFLLKTKCRVIAEDIGVQDGDIVLKRI